MTTWIAADTPSNVVTLEQLHVWSGIVLQFTSGGLLIPEVVGAAPEIAVTCNPFLVTAETNNYHTRMLTRSSIRLNTAWQSTRVWLAAQELTTTAIPAWAKLV